MARPALSADRALVVLETLASHAARRFTLSELVEATGVNPSSMHALLAVLEQRGWVVRHPVHRTYALGPVPLVTGAVAAGQQTALRAATEDLHDLSRRLGCEAILSVRVLDEILVVDRAGEDSPFGAPLRIGQRIPLAPPLGTVFLAWASESDIDTWLGRARPALLPAEVVEQRRVVHTVRERGYAITLDSPARQRFNNAMSANATRDGRGASSELDGLLDALARSHYNVESLDDGRLYDLSTIAAPIFDEHARVAAAVSVSGLPPGASAIDVRHAADDVRGVALLATKRAGGELPRDDGADRSP